MSDPASPPHVVFAGGGTGGHIYPSIAIAEAIRQRHPDATCTFLCSRKDVDAHILSHEMLPFVASTARPVAGSPAKAALGLAAIPSAIHQARRVLRAPLGPHAPRATHLITMGGYVAFPAALAAKSLGIPVLAVNIDAVVGLANRRLRSLATHSLDASLTGPHDRWTRVPPIVRHPERFQQNPADAKHTLGLDPDRPLLLVTGGSLGAATLNEFAATFIEHHAAHARPEWQVLHQCGPDWESFSERYLELSESLADAATPSISLRAVRYIDDMPAAWSAADAAIARAGAGTVAEALASQTPTAFFPYPYHADQHQRLNAEPLARAGGALLLEDTKNPTSDAMKSASQLLDTLLRTGHDRSPSASSDHPGDADMKQALARLGPVDGADRIAEIL